MSMSRRGFLARMGAGALAASAVSTSHDPIMQLTEDQWLASAAQDSVQSFSRRMVPGYIGGDHIHRLTTALEAIERGDLTRLIVTMPPRHSKSLNVSENFPAWYLGRHPDQRIIAASHTAQLAYTFSRRVRNKIADPRYPFDVAVADDKGAVQAWDTDAGGGYIAVGAGGSPTGHGGNGIIIDDPLRSAADADSQTMRDNLWEWYQGTMRTRLQPGGWIILTATRWHTDDLTGRLLQQADHGGEHWHHLHMPAIDESGDALWPEFWPLEDLRKIQQSVGTRVWQAQYQGDPQPAEGGMFKRHWWRYWQPRNANLPPVAVKQPDGSTQYVHAVEQPGWWDSAAQSWDMSFKKTETGSYVVGIAGARSGPNGYILEHRFRERTDFPGTINAVQTMIARYPDVAAKLVEEKANGAAVIDTLRSSISGLIAVQTDGSKEARASASTARVEAHNWFLPHPVIAPWVEEFVDECVTGETQIITRDGLKRIDAIQVGDHVMTHRGRFRPVLDVFTRTSDHVYRIGAKTLDPLFVTGNHPAYAMRIGNPRKATDLRWTSVASLTPRRYTERQRNGQAVREPTMNPHDALTIPVLSPDSEQSRLDMMDYVEVPTKRRMRGGAIGNGFIVQTDDTWVTTSHGRSQRFRRYLDLDYRMGRLFGLYLAEGSWSGYQAVWSFSEKEHHLIDEVSTMIRDNLGLNPCMRTGHGSTSVYLSSRHHVKLFAQMGDNAGEKRLAPWMWETSEQFMRGLVEGWSEGDGHHATNGAWRVTSISRSLVWQMRTVLARLGISASCRQERPERVEALFDGRASHCQPSYLLEWRPGGGVYSAAIWMDEAVGYSLIDHERVEGDVQVFNMHVEDDESYVTTGGTVHNCASFPTGAHDDYVDTFSQLDRYLFSGSGYSELDDYAHAIFGGR